MKFLIASDIHGSAKYLKMLLEAFKKEKPDKMLLLGDILYHGPRNDLPENYAPKEIIALLNPLKDKLLCVRGNCDTEVDQMVLDFPILADYAVIPVGSRLIYATHGHKFSPQTPPPIANGDILLNGHTHVPKCEDMGDFTYLNCGSVSIPKENSPHSFMILQNGKFEWKNLLNGEVYNEYSV
ncbi:MAG: phosphodiesterase [Ruminococcaceae bacterium]|nr:phosphodiesterase [Oscillospiraceae bacterium]